MRDDIHPGPRIISGKAELPCLKPEPWMIQASCATADPDGVDGTRKGKRARHRECRCIGG